MESILHRAESPPEDSGFDQAELSDRVRRTQQEMRDRELDLLILTEQGDIHYLTGARDLLGTLPMVLVVPADGIYTLVTRAVDGHAFRPQCAESRIVEYFDHESPLEAISTAVREYGQGGGRLGVSLQGTGISPALIDRLRAELGEFEWIDASRIVWELCAVKSDAELAHMREAARIADLALEDALDAMRPGVLDQDVAAALVAGMLRHGSHMTPGYYQVVSGRRTLTAHATHNGSRLDRGDHVLFEFTACRYRYNAPLMRTAVLGQPSDDMCRMHDAATQALEAAMAAMRPGVTSGEVHQAANAVLDEFGMGHLRPHRTGYLVGASPAATSGGWPQGHILNLRAGDASVLRTNMTFHLPMALYLPSAAAIGVSETVVVTPGGGEALGATPRSLLQAGTR